MTRIIICILIFIFVILTGSSIRYMIINRKNFKYLFKISPEHKVRDILQILIYLCVIFSIIGFFVYHNVASYKPYDRDNARIRLKKDVVDLAMAVDKITVFGETIDEVKTDAELALMLSRYMQVLGTYNFEIDGKEKIQERYLKPVAEYAEKPSFQAADGSLYTILKFENGCMMADKENIENSDCIIQINTTPWSEKKEYAHNTINVAIFSEKDKYKITADKYL